MASERRVEEELVSANSISTVSKVAISAVKRWYRSRPLPTHGPNGRRMPSFSELASHRSISKYRDYQEMFKLQDPLVQVHEQRSGAEAMIGGRGYANFASYDYLGLNQHPEVGAAAIAAIKKFGTSVSASRLVAGERPVHRELEAELSQFYDTEDALVYVSGHATNVSAISTIVGPKDIVFYDEFIHNSATTGAKLSGAKMVSFVHNDPADLESKLALYREDHKFALILIEGLYSMDGDVPDLARFIEIKQRFGAWLMVDEAHGLGVLGESGHGIAEHCGIDPNEVDIWMGTLSKTLSSCGGYVAGRRELIDVLKYQSPGFVYSVGMPAPATAAAVKSLEILQRSPERVARVQANGRYFLAQCKEHGLDTGLSEGHAVVPVIVGDAVLAIRLTDRIFKRGVNALPIIYPAVPLKSDRVRFFITSEHTQEQLSYAARVTREELDRLAGKGSHEKRLRPAG